MNDQIDPNPLKMILAGHLNTDPNHDDTLSGNEEEAIGDSPLKPLLSYMEAMVKKVSKFEAKHLTRSVLCEYFWKQVLQSLSSLLKNDMAFDL